MSAKVRKTTQGLRRYKNEKRNKNNDSILYNNKKKKKKKTNEGVGV